MRVLIGRKVNWFLKLFAITGPIDDCNAEEKLFWETILYEFTGLLSKLLLASNQCDSVISNTKHGNHKRPLRKEMISAKKRRKFSTITSTIMSLEYVLINCWIAPTEAKHPLSSKRQALSNSLKATPVQISFCLSCNQREGHFHESYERQTPGHCRKRQVLPIQWYFKVSRIYSKKAV